MIKSFRHKGLQRYFETGSKAGIQKEAMRFLSIIWTITREAANGTHA